jgi:hypothetical protein
MTRLVLSLLRKAARNTRADVDDTKAARVATYPAAVRALALVMLVMLVIGIVGAAIVAGYNATHGAPLRGTVIAAAIVAVPLVTATEFTSVRVEWTDTAVNFASPWNAPRSAAWEDIVEVKYSKTAGWFVVRAPNGAKIRLSHLLGGLGDLLEEMKRRGSDEVRGQGRSFGTNKYS